MNITFADWSVVSVDPERKDQVQFGWTAGWNPVSITPDVSMSSMGSSGDKEMMSKALKRFYGHRETACVLPDSGIWASRKFYQRTSEHVLHLV